MSIDDLVDQGLISRKVYNHVKNIEKIDFSEYEQPDSIWLLNNKFHSPTYKLTVSGLIRITKKVRYIHSVDKYLFRFLIEDETDNIWCCFWENADMYPFHLDTIPRNVEVELHNCRLSFNDFNDHLELTIYSFDDIIFLS